MASISSGKNLTLPDDADPDKFHPKSTHRTINALWFSSLTLSLIVSMLAILAKQWIGMFVSRMRVPVPDLRYWAHRHRAYRDGLDKWKITAFVSSLSIFLHLSLFLFLIGLIIHSYELDRVVFILVTVLCGLALVIYVATTFAPLFEGTCPTATPLLIHGREVILWVWNRFRTLEASVAAPFDETRIVSKDVDYANVDILAWVVNNLRGEQEVDVALDAFWALPRQSNTPAADQADAAVTNDVTHPVAPRLASTASETGRPAHNFLISWLRRRIVGKRNDELEAQTRELTRTLRSNLAQHAAETHENDPYLSRLCRLVNYQQTSEIETTAARESATNGGPAALPAMDELAKNILTSRLRRLVVGSRSDELDENGGELARAVRSIMRLVIGVGNLPEIGDLRFTLMGVRTHDVAVLSAIIFEDLGPQNKNDEGPTYFRIPVGWFGLAFGAWAQQPIQRRIVSPITLHTRDILFNYLTRYRLSVNLYGALVLVFCQDPVEAQRWIGLTNMGLSIDLACAHITDIQVQWDRDHRDAHGFGLPDSPKLEIPWSNDAMVSALQAWSSMLMWMEANRVLWMEANQVSFNYKLIQQQHQRSVQCFLLVLKLSGNVSSVPHIQNILAPFSTAQIPDTVPALINALRLIRFEVHSREWNTGIAVILFCILNRLRRRQSSLHAKHRENLAEMIAGLSHRSGNNDFGHLVNAARVHDLLHRVDADSAVSILIPRNVPDGSPTSIWRLAVEFCTDDLSRFADSAAWLCTHLTVFAALDIDLDIDINFAGMYEQLLGNGHGSRIILAARTSKKAAFNIARHAASSARALWEEMCTELRAGEWHAVGDEWGTLDDFIREAEAAPACEECLQGIETLQAALAEAASARILTEDDVTLGISDLLAEDEDVVDR